MKRWGIFLAAFLFTLCGVMMIVPGSRSNPQKEGTGKLAGFYVVDVWDDDFYPYWQSAIVRVAQRVDSTKVDYVYLASATLPCNAPAVRGKTVTLRSTDLQQLTNGLNLCEIDADRFNQEAERYTKKLEPYNTLRSAVVAVCGERVSVFKMPAFKMNERLLKEREPSVERMLKLFDYVLMKTFPRDRGKAISEGPSLSEIAPDSLQAQELKAGHFDNGFWFGFKGAHPAIPAQVVDGFDPTVGSDSDVGKLHNVLARYKKPNPENAVRTGSLVDSQGYNLKQFVPPVYSRLAVQVGLSGRVTLLLRVNRTTGQVENVEVTSGHDLLKQGAIESAMHWQFDSSQKLPEKISAVLDFSVLCDKQ